MKQTPDKDAVVILTTDHIYKTLCTISQVSNFIHSVGVIDGPFAGEPWLSNKAILENPFTLVVKTKKPVALERIVHRSDFCDGLAALAADDHDAIKRIVFGSGSAVDHHKLFEYALLGQPAKKLIESMREEKKNGPV